MHAPMHMYTAQEVGELFDKCTLLETAGSNVTISERAKQAETIAASADAWETLVELKMKLNHDPGLVNTGSHIIMVFRKSL